MPTQSPKPFFHNKDKIKKLILWLGIFVLIFIVGTVVYDSTTLNTQINPAAILDNPSTSTDPFLTASSTSTSTASIPILTAATPTPGVKILPAQTASNIGHVIGIAGGGGLSKLSLSDLNQQLDLMAALGVKWVRFDIEWGIVQYDSPNKSNWTSYDNLVKAIVAHHMNALGIIVFTPEWARVPGCKGGIECPPQDPATFATFASQVAARYKGQGLHYWEIWNEPNNFNFWATKTDCNAYTALLKVTYPAIKKVDPQSVIITGGLAPESTNDVNISEPDFLSCIYSNGGKNYFDAVGDHPYTYPRSPAIDTGGAWARMSLTSPSLRSIMVLNGDSAKKIWFTEFGTPTNGPDSNWFVSEAQQSQMVTDTIQLYKSYPWAGPLFWYTFKDSGTTPDNNENFFGLIRNDNSLKAAYSTLKNLISAGL